MQNPRIGIVAASSVVPRAEFEAGVAHLRDNGFDVRVHPQVLQQHFTFAGTDELRAGSLFDFARDPSLDVMWLARGGYGATRLLPMLDELTAGRGRPPHKLLVGYSDVTVLHEYVRARWKWSTLHAPMPAASNFSKLRPAEWDAIVACVRGQRPRFAWEATTLTFITRAPSGSIEAELIGGNLALWAAVAGTPYASSGDGKLLFFEDTGEKPYRLDRMVTQLVQSGAFDGAVGIILGNFTDCEDEDTLCLEPLPDGADPRTLFDNLQQRRKISLRRVYTLDEAIQEIFGTLGQRLGIPVAKGLPVGHGPNFSPLPLGARFRITETGQLSLIEWGWFARHGSQC
jgi:muramoyltetrapeptide carboxypeptidase